MVSESKHLISYRLEQAQESLQDAGILLEHQGTPRAVINRCYYAIFYAVQALLGTKGMTTSKHYGAISLFDKEFVMTGEFDKYASKDVHLAFELRQEWDYKVIDKLDKINEQEALEKAQAFVAKTEEYLGKHGYLIPKL